MLTIDLRGKIAFIAGVADQNGYGFAIAKALYQAGATVLIGTWPPVYKIFTQSLELGKLDSARKLDSGALFEIAKIYPLDAAFDTREDIPEDILNNKRYKDLEGYSIQEVVEKVRNDYGRIDILVHSLANGPEVGKPLLETSRAGYLAAVSASAYSFVSLLSSFGPIMEGSKAAVSLTYMASEKAIPGYGGGMSSSKAALESDTKILSYEAGRKWGVRVNTISCGPLASRAAKAIGFIDTMIHYTKENAPLPKEMEPHEVGNTAAFLLSDLASGITGSTIYVDQGIHVMGIAPSHPLFQKEVE